MNLMDEVSTSVAANSTNANVLANRRYVNAPFDGFLAVLETGSAAGLESEINVGGISVTPRVPCNANNRSPLEPDDLRVDGIEVMAGQLIQISVTNTTAGALTHRVRIVYEEGEEFFEEDFY